MQPGSTESSPDHMSRRLSMKDQLSGGIANKLGIAQLMAKAQSVKTLKSTEENVLRRKNSVLT